MPVPSDTLRWPPFPTLLSPLSPHVPLCPRCAERAYRCNVCRSLFTVAPPKQRHGARFCQALRGLGVALCVIALAFGLSGEGLGVLGMTVAQPVSLLLRCLIALPLDC